MTLHEIKGYTPREKTNKIKLNRHTKSSDTDKKKKKYLISLTLVLRNNPRHFLPWSMYV